MKKSLFCILVLTPAVVYCMETKQRDHCHHHKQSQGTGEQAQFFRLNESEQRDIDLAVNSAKPLAECRRKIFQHGWMAVLGASMPSFMLTTLIGSSYYSNAPMIKVLSFAVVIGGLIGALGYLGASLWHYGELEKKQSEARENARTWAESDIGGPIERTIKGRRYGLIEAIRKFPRELTELPEDLRNADRYLINAFADIYNDMRAFKAKQKVRDQKREQREERRGRRAAEH